MTKEETTEVREFEGIEVTYPSEDICIYPEYKGKPYFGIRYRENGESIVGYGTYNPQVLSRYLKDYFMSTTKNDIRYNRVENELNRVKDELEPTTKNNLGVGAVSRKDVHDMLENLPVAVEDKWFNWLQKACMRLAELPPVTPQEPCKDVVSRSEIKRIAKEMYLEVANMEFDAKTISDCISCTSSKCREVLERKLQALPSVTPQEPNTWSLDDAREDFMHDVYNELDFLPTNEEANRIIDSFDRVTSSIEQAPRKGEWLRMSDLSEQEDDRYKCSCCGNVIHDKNKMDLYTFHSWCGRCGSDNGRHIKYEDEE